MNITSDLDEDAFHAAADLVGRTGATSFQIGYLNDEPPHQWYAHAQYKGARITAENLAGPVEAAETLARRILSGGKCMKCGGLIALSSAGAVAYDSATLTDGTDWTAEKATAAGVCRWTRMGKRWEAGCLAT
jgi:hypothetical protein